MLLPLEDMKDLMSEKNLDEEWCFRYSVVATKPTTRKRRRSARLPTTPTIVAVVDPRRDAAGLPTAVDHKQMKEVEHKQWNKFECKHRFGFFLIQMKSDR